MLRRTLAIAGAGGRRAFHAGRVLDPELRRQLPGRTPRDEFTVLKCLARTAGVDADSVPHYAIDDSLFLRYRQSAIGLARRSGRNMARYFLESNAAQLADLNKECPPVPAWRPLRPLDSLDCSEASLRLLIGLERVGASWQMYNKLLADAGGKAAVSDDARQSLLELLAYHGGVEPPLRDISPEEVYFAEKPLLATAAAGRRSVWAAPDNPARVLYASMKPPSLAATSAMLKAHWRHSAGAECLALYAEVAGNPRLDAESHNCALLATAAKRGAGGGWAAALALFRRLPRLDATAYKCLLKALALTAMAAEESTASVVGDQKCRAELVCSVLAEMAQRGLPLTLGVCAVALSAAYAPQLRHSQLDRLQGPNEWLSNPGQPEARVGLLPSLLAALSASPPDPLDANSPDDLAFFPAAAYLACRVYASRALAQQLDALLHSGAFLSALATFKERRIVYEYHLLGLLTDSTAPLDSALRYYAERIAPSGTGQHSHLVRLMRRCVQRQAVDRLPGLMVHCLACAEQADSGLLRPGMAFFRCAEIVVQMFADGHPATRDADFLADLRRCLVGVADALNNEFVYERRRKSGDRERPPDLKSSLEADNCAMLLRLATRLPEAAGADREFTMQLAGMLAECVAQRRTSSLAYMLALMELAATLRASPSYEQRAVCLAVADLLDRTAHEFQAKRSDKSDVAGLGRLAELAESASRYLAACGHPLAGTQVAAHQALARGATELRDRGGDAATAAARAAAAATAADGLDDSAWAVVDVEASAEAESADSSDSDEDTKPR